MRVPSHTTVVAYLALFVALGGASYAAISIPRNTVGTPQLKPGAVTSGKVRDGTLRRRDFARGQLRAGAQGAAGAKGDAGAAGATGAAGARGADGSPDTAADVLAKLAAVDGASSGLDADRFDGVDDASNLARTVGAQVTLSGDPAEEWEPVLAVPGYGVLEGDCDNSTSFQTRWNGITTGLVFVDTGSEAPTLKLGNPTSPVDSTSSVDGHVWLISANVGGELFEAVITAFAYSINPLPDTICPYRVSATYKAMTP